MIERIHHFDIVVRDLERAVDRYSKVLGVLPGPREKLEHRGIELVRFRVGDVWLILVHPVRDDSPVQAFLDEHGEGFFHVAYKVADVEAEATRIAGSGIRLANAEPRRGVEGWKLIDLVIEDTEGVMTQLIEEPEEP
jgi:methylmalonyl-CoA/ethylmalonyl-CoA epimerase